MSEFEIESNIEIPARQGKKSKYPWSELEINQSFFVPGGNQSSLTSGGHRYGKENGKRFKAVKTEHDGVEGIRVWRIDLKENEKDNGKKK